MYCGIEHCVFTRNQYRLPSISVSRIEPFVLRCFSAIVARSLVVLACLSTKGACDVRWRVNPTDGCVTRAATTSVINLEADSDKVNASGVEISNTISSALLQHLKASGRTFQTLAINMLRSHFQCVFLGDI